MTRDADGGAGVRHLAVLARRPRPAGGEAEGEARSYAASVLQSCGFTTSEERFDYSAFPGRYGTPAGGALLGSALIAAAACGLNGRPLVAAVLVLLGVATTALLARRLMRGVLDLPWMRSTSVNLVAVRGPAEPRVWLVAHLDSKSQPVPSMVRVGGVLLTGLALALAIVALAVQLGSGSSRTLWWAALILAISGALPVVLSVVGTDSDGAVDNASGAAAVLAAAALLDGSANVGVLMPSAEELGLAGAAAWARTRAPATAINCDGVDDDGALVVMYNGASPTAIVDAVRSATTRRVDVRRMPLGLLTDSTALARAGWHAGTVSHGSPATLRRVHRPSDSLEHLRGTSIDDVAFILARAAEALA